ncbi:zf-HC2 domain-containing protein [Streptomyces sp. TR06-5]|uniref:zf-HC2 domain-containing protein n=1 Tax=unclassified Streptomyces TaxID=2593676 RepID=UPI0039A2C5F3
MNSDDNRSTPVEQHLGDRLAALIDGELGHDARERVLAHLATCWNCKAEADAQRRVKSVFADTAPPAPSDGLLARLQGLPAGGDALPGGRPPLVPPGAGARPLPSDALGGGRLPLQLVPLAGGDGPSLLTPGRGVRSHRADDLERSSSRSRRFAFAAAGAFSLAALALTGTVGAGSAGGGAPVAAGERGGAAAGQARPAATAMAASERESRRRSGFTEERRSGRGTAPAPASTVSLRQQPIGLVAAARAPSPLAAFSVVAPPPLRPPRVLPPALPGGAGRTPAASAAPAPPPSGLPMAGARP